METGYYYGSIIIYLIIQRLESLATKILKCSTNYNVIIYTCKPFFKRIKSSRVSFPLSDYKWRCYFYSVANSILLHIGIRSFEVEEAEEI